MTQPDTDERPTLGDDVDRRLRSAYNAASTTPLAPTTRGDRAGNEPTSPRRRSSVLLGAAAAILVIGVGAPVTIAALDGTDEDRSSARSDQAGPGAPGTTPSSRHDVDAATLRWPGSHNYQPFATLTDMVARSEVAVSGRIVSWSEGRTVIDAGIATRYAVVAVEVEQASKVTAPSQRDVAYFSLRRGSEFVGSDGEPLPPGKGAPATVRTLDELEQAAPVGVRVILVGNPTPSPEPRLPEGATLVTPQPQGFILRTAAGGFEAGIVATEDIEAWAAHAAGLAGDDATTSGAPGSFDNLVAELARAPY